MEACTVAILTVINSFDNPMVNLVSVFVMYYIYTAVVYPASPFKCIRSSICFYMLVMTSEFMAVILFSLSNLHDAKSALKNELSGLRFAMIAKMITFVMSKCIEQVHKKSQHEKVSNSIFCYLLILQGSTIILFARLFCVDLHISEKNKIFLEVGTVMLLFANVFMFYLFDKLIENMEKANKVERLYMKSRTEKKHYQQIEQINEQHRVLLHDIKKYIRTAAELVQEGDKEHMLYEDLKDGIVSKEDYAELYEGYNSRRKKAEEAVRKINHAVRDVLDAKTDKYEWLRYFKEYRNISELSRTAAVGLIDRVKVYDKNRIGIDFSFDDCFQSALRQIQSAGRTVCTDEDGRINIEERAVV